MIKYILVVLTVGGIAGFLNSGYGAPIFRDLVSDYLFTGSLAALLFVMGLVFALDKESVAKIRRRGFRILLIPAGVAAGSILGGLVGGLVLGINVVGSAAVCAGYGWYTLAGPMVGQILGSEWSAYGFSVNFLRELLTIVTIPLLVKVDKYAGVASGGATAMDTTLPAIVKYCGSEALITAFTSGFILSVAAPFTIIAITSLT